MSDDGWIEVTNKKPKNRKPQLPPSSIHKHHPTANTIFKEQYNKLANYINHDKTRETEIYSIHFQKNMNIHYDYYLNFGEKVCKNSCCLPVNNLTPGNKYVQPKIIVEKDKKKISSIIGLIFHLPTEEQKQKTLQLLELQLRSLQKSNDALGCFDDEEESGQASEAKDGEKVKREKLPCNITEKREGGLKGMRHLLFVSLRQYIENQAADISLPCDSSNTHSVKFGKRENALKRFKVFEKYIHSFEDDEEDDEEEEKEAEDNNNNNNNNEEEEKKEKISNKLDEYYLLFGLDTPIEFIDEKTGKKQEYKESNLSLPGGSSFEHPRETCIKRLEEETGISPKLLEFLHPPISFISFTFNRPMYFYFFEVELKGEEEKEKEKEQGQEN